VKEKVPEVVFLIAGEGEERPSLEEQISRLNLQKSVLLLGYRDDIGDIMRCFDLFVLSSHLEGLCTSLLDAIALGIPVVAARTGGVPDVVADRETGMLVEPKNPGALADAILYTRQHPEEMHRMTQNARNRVLQSFTIESMVAKTVAVYQNIINQYPSK
jgi:glycosyltransferase involved in cell wall biosynthesis